mmetsp:Transcript_63587/g.196903  ORF Transcript_63587/g.196903 Transcript_63587/m.196903 type:complete len:376 (+) Transcript_63587:137-1264(+)
MRRVADGSASLGRWDRWYEAPWWLRQADAMTIYAAKFREEEEVEYDRRLVETLDGGVVALDVVRSAGGRAPAELDGRAPFGLLVSGLGGGSQDAYVRNMAAALVRAGCCVGVLNMRGCGGSPVRTPRLFSAYRGSTDDVRVGVRYVRQQLLGGGSAGEEGDVLLVGWSNGATIVANALAEQTTRHGKGHDPRWTRANAGAILAAPYDMPRSTEHLEGKLFQRLIYNRLVTRSLARQFKPHTHLFNKGPVPRWLDDVPDVSVDVDLLMGAQTIRDVDEAITRKVFGYESVDDYYFHASCYQRLQHVDVPLLMVSAADDPMSTGWIPIEEVRENRNLLLAYTEHGGHLGWQDAENCGRSDWAEQAVVDFFRAAVQQS